MRRSRLALGLALAALAAALVGALGPADDVRTTYSWPPAELPSAEPSRAWYAPLLLIRREPEAVSVRVDCSLPATLPRASRRPIVVATTRSPADGGLFVTTDGEALDVAVGQADVARVAVARDPGEDECVYQLDLRDGRLSVERAGIDAALPAMPVVNGLFSELDLAAATAPSIAVTTAPHGARPSLAQKLAWILAALAIAAALLVVAFERAPRPTGTALGKAARSARPEDAAVALVLLVWWIVGPAFIDDGWVVARERTFADTGGFSNYYDTLGANVPLGFWLEWTQHWLTERTSTVMLLRVPALLCLAATWALCRFVLTRVLPSGAGGVALWAAAAAFVAGALAWGMTLRPEPAIALFVTAVLACTIRFLERGGVAPLAAVGLLVPLALTGHHTGVVSLAPLVAAAPALFAWARPRIAVAGTVVAASFACLVVLAFVGADAGQRRSDAETFRAITSTRATWRDELLRYVRLSEFPSATPLRRVAVVLIGLAVLAYLLRRRRDDRQLLDLPAAALGVGLVLLVATPSKWPWHFGALLGIAAVAVACETARLRRDAARSGGWEARPLVALGAVLVTAAWIWSPRSAWNRVDLRVLDWTPAFEGRLGLTELAFALPLALLAALGLVEAARRRGGLHRVPWRVAAWAAPVLVVPALAFTVTVLVADAAGTSSWTLTRQNVDSLRGASGCGLADDLLVAPSVTLAKRIRSSSSTLVLPELLMYFPCVRQPALRDGVVEPPELVVTPFVGTSWLRTWETSPFEGVLDLYPVEQVSLAGSENPPPEVALLEVDARLPGAQPASPEKSTASG